MPYDKFAAIDSSTLLFPPTVRANLAGVSPNYIINGGFDIWQRGTSFTQSSNGYTADRWTTEQNAAATITRQTFTPGTELTPSSFFLRYQATSAGSVHGISTRIEDVRTLAGQTATLSFWAKAAATTTLTVIGTQWFGSGGSSVFDTFTTTFTLTTSWQRFTYTTAIASISGKTVGDGSYLGIRLLNLTNTTFTMDIDGVQLEAGSSATVFRRNANSIQGELAACQRYYQIVSYQLVQSGVAYAEGTWPVPFRASPTISVVARTTGSGGTVGATGYAPTTNFTITAYNSASCLAKIEGVSEL